MRLRLGLGLALVALTGATACFEDTGGNTPTDSTSGDGDGDGDSTGDGDGAPSGDGDGEPTTGAEDCAASELCVDQAIAGWDGPLAIYAGSVVDTPPACQGNTPIKIAELFTELDSNDIPATCTCTCSQLQDASCGPVTLRQSSQPGCGNTVKQWEVGPTECLDLGGLQASSRYAASPSPLSGSCTPGVGEDIVPAVYRTQILACGLEASAPACGTGGVCMQPPAEPFDGRICIATEGDVQCPNGPYAERFVYHTGVQDNRSCGGCSCNLPPDAQCTGEVRLFGNACGFQGLLLGSVDVGGCTAASVGNVELANFIPEPPMAGCDASGGGIEGEIDELGAWTFCCQ